MGQSYGCNLCTKPQEDKTSTLVSQNPKKSFKKFTYDQNLTNLNLAYNKVHKVSSLVDNMEDQSAVLSRRNEALSARLLHLPEPLAVTRTNTKTLVSMRTSDLENRHPVEKLLSPSKELSQKDFARFKIKSKSKKIKIKENHKIDQNIDFYEDLEASGVPGSLSEHNGKRSTLYKLNYTDGSWYNGELARTQNSDFLRQGYGKLHFANGSWYEGHWKTNKPHGYGHFRAQNGDSYKGDFWHGKFNGMGTYTFKTGSYYEGEWQDNLKHGKGIETVLEKNSKKLKICYKGFFKKGKKHGKGCLIWASGTEYEGYFASGEFEGTGVLKSSDGSLYKGEWFGGLRHGLGTLIYPNGDIYRGSFRNDMKSGEGRYTWKSDGKIYEGSYQDDVENGRGKLILPTGQVVISFFRDGKNFDSFLNLESE